MAVCGLLLFLFFQAFFISEKLVSMAVNLSSGPISVPTLHFRKTSQYGRLLFFLLPSRSTPIISEKLVSMADIQRFSLFPFYHRYISEKLVSMAGSIGLFRIGVPVRISEKLVSMAVLQSMHAQGELNEFQKNQLVWQAEASALLSVSMSTISEKLVSMAVLISFKTVLIFPNFRKTSQYGSAISFHSYTFCFKHFRKTSQYGSLVSHFWSSDFQLFQKNQLVWQEPVVYVAVIEILIHFRKTSQYGSYFNHVFTLLSLYISEKLVSMADLNDSSIVVY